MGAGWIALNIINMKYPHLFLRNPLGSIDYVYTNRYIGESNDENEEVKIKDYSFQKEKFRSNLRTFKEEKTFRETHRTLDLPYHFEYIEIHFFDQFKKDFAGGSDFYKNEFGLIPVRYTDFNKTVLFYIENERLFARFVHLIEQFFNSPEEEDPSDKEYHVVTFIYSFEFLSSRKITEISNERIIISLTDKLSGIRTWSTTSEMLLSYIRKKGGHCAKISEGVFEISNVNDFIDEIADNFDVIQRIQSIPPVHVTPGAFGTPKFEWDFNTMYNENLPVIGIIDSGIDKNVTPLQPLIIGQTSILDREYGIGSSHGTSVASLVAFGKDLLSGENPKKSFANLYSIQVMHSDEGNFSYDKLKKAIIQAHDEYNIRIFNLSVCGTHSFEYNAEYSAYAKMLDELAYTYDLLIFIATGNLDDGYIDFMKSEFGPDTHLINYPNHYYNEWDNDYSQPTNIGSPAESMNNITIGAIACNNFDNTTDLTDHHTLLCIKSTYPWSEDFGYINRQLLSNTQKKEWIINKQELLNIKNEFAVVTRCLGKENYINEGIENPYSLVISIEEYNDIGLDESDLYQEISAINEVENMIEIETELDIEIAD